MTKTLNWIKAVWDRAQNALAGARAQPLLALLGLLSGLIAGTVVILFRLSIESAQSGFLPGANPENYEALETGWRFVLTMSGGVVLGVLFLFARTPLRVGVIHVMERLAYHEGYLPFRNAMMQFFGGAIAVISGQSVGREGPGIHLGAACSSLLGQKLKLPDNSTRTLVACGVAAAIAASFNTPLAGVIFAMEVVLMEYTISGFTPVILAAVAATSLNRIVYGTSPFFVVSSVELVSFYELVVIAAMGAAIGAVAALFIVLLRWISRLGRDLHITTRLIIAGAGVGICSVFAPEIMSIGYDTVNLALKGDILIGTLLLILIFKIIATAVSIGLGTPAGLIGPSLFMGAMAGCLTGLLMQMTGGVVSDPGLYTMLGMGAMMGATLQAPLAALLALVELTGNVNIVFPGMLAIISANLAVRELFRQESVFHMQMKEIGLDYKNDPVSQSLRRLAVSAVMDTSFVLTRPVISREDAEHILVATNPRWLVIDQGQTRLLMPAADLAHYLQIREGGEQIDLQEIPSKRRKMTQVRRQSTLQQALASMERSETEAIYISGFMGLPSDTIYGVATWQDVYNGYRTGPVSGY